MSMQSSALKTDTVAEAPSNGAFAENAETQLLGKVTGACREWVSQISRMQQLDLAFAIKLTGCRQPAEAAKICGEWMSHRVDSAVAMQHRLLGFWLDANTKAMTKPYDRAEQDPS